MILLDTDVMIDVMRKRPPAVAWLTTIPAKELSLCGLVVMELLQGCRTMEEEQRP